MNDPQGTFEINKRCSGKVTKITDLELQIKRKASNLQAQIKVGKCLTVV